jgi:hypothetical protein
VAGHGELHLDASARSSFDRLYDPPWPAVTVLGIALVVAAGALVVLLVRRLARAEA